MNEWWRRYVRKDGIVFDIGANVGDTVVEFARQAEFVFAFEPNPKCFNCLSERTRDLKNVACLPIGLSDMAEVRKVFVFENWTLLPITPVDPRYQDRQFCPEHPNDLKKDFSSLFVTLDWLQGILPIPDFIKIDVDGMEGRVVRGGGIMLRNHHPLLYVEVGRHAMEQVGDAPGRLLHFLEQECGYRFIFDSVSKPTALDLNGILPLVSVGKNGGDIFCVPAERWDSTLADLRGLV